MKRKILTSTLTLLFLVSTTGLPATISLCKMAEAEETYQCMMHNKPVKSQCCEETSESPFITSFENTGCCQTEFVYNKVQDEFLCNKIGISFSSQEDVLQPLAILPPAVDFYYSESFYCDSSPPFLINPELHISNSVLLI
jgi:hypothetical protein